MDMPRNAFKHAIAQGQVQIGLWCSLCNRPAWNDMVLIKRYLDIGAQTLLLPFVQTPEEARRAVEWTRYPPRGMRGITGSGRASRYGRVREYLKNATSEICVLVQAESRAAIT